MEMIDAELLADFVIESQEGLAHVERQMLAIEAGGAQPDAELVNAVFRTMHTIKGTAGFLGLDRIGSLAHGLEEVLDDLRNRELVTSAELVTSILKAADHMKDLLAAVEKSNEADVAPYVTDLQRHRHVSRPHTPAASVGLAAEHDRPSATVRQPTPTAANAGEPPHAADSTLRVDVSLLDKLMTRVGELVLARNQIVQYTGRMDDAGFASAAGRLNLITAELQESVMKTRMQPIGNVWTRFPRVARDLAAQLGKQVRMEMEGKETELDKTIVEAIKDPLTHLVRNSIDHGIEDPQRRRAAGKPAEGRLLLRAYHEGGQVNIEITDDGAGLNLERIRQTAVERGLLNAEQARRLSDRDAAQLIFTPGFSTAERVTSVSGRGVGMDVVKTNIERISGTIDIETRPGKGTTVRVKIPLTLAIIPALIVTNDGDRYAIPQASLLELVRLEGDDARRDIEYVHGAPVYRLRGELLPLTWLSERLALQPRQGDVLNVVVLRANDRQFGLVVDKVNDTEEIVVKPLSRQLKGLAEYAGATIMGDGTVALILDVVGLARAAGLAADVHEQHQADSPENPVAAARSETLLVVDLGGRRRCALPTSMISRLERAARASIEWADGREVIQYRGAILPLARLSEVFGAGEAGAENQEEFQIVVYSDRDARCGFVVNRIIDIVETELRLDEARDDESHLLGTAIIQQRVTDVLNLSCLARRRVAPAFTGVRGI